MTSDELNDAAAREVMLWVPGIVGNTYWHDPVDLGVRDRIEWDPYQDANQAMECLEQIQDLCSGVEMSVEMGRQYAVTLQGVGFRGEALGDTFAEALTHACLKFMRARAANRSGGSSNPE